MKIKKATEYLSQVTKINRELNALLEEANLMHKLAAECDGANAKSAAISVRRYAKKINDKVAEYIKTLEKIKITIDAVPDEYCQTLLIKRYLCDETWEKIAEEMNFSVAHIYRLRKKALSLLKI